MNKKNILSNVENFLLNDELETNTFFTNKENQHIKEKEKYDRYVDVVSATETINDFSSPNSIKIKKEGILFNENDSDFLDKYTNEIDNEIN